MGVTEVDGE